MERENEIVSDIHRDSRKGRSTTPNNSTNMDRRKTFFSQLNTQTNKKTHAVRNTRKPKKETLESKAAALKIKIERVNEKELEARLHDLLLNKQWEQTVVLLLASSILYQKYKISDVIRHVIEQNNFMDSMKLIHDLKAISHPVDQLCVSLLIKKLVEEEDFVTAVEFAQEMVPNFGATSVDGKISHEKNGVISWTPKTLIQAMIRVKQYRKAARYSKQLGMDQVFPCSQLIISMMEAQQWENAVTTIFENRTVAESGVTEALIRKLIEYHQWNLALKCICKVRVKTLADELTALLVCGACAQGDFVFVMSYIRDNKLSPIKKQDAMLLECFMESLLKHQEFYKAIKYAIKLGLIDSGHISEDKGKMNGKKYSMERLLRATMDCGQYHVAKRFIKKLGLVDSYRTELDEMEHLKKEALLEFRKLMSMRVEVVMSEPMRRKWENLVGEKEFNDIESKIVDVVIMQEDETFCDDGKMKGDRSCFLKNSVISNTDPNKISMTIGDDYEKDDFECLENNIDSMDLSLQSQQTLKKAEPTKIDNENNGSLQALSAKSMAVEPPNSSWRPPLPSDHEVHKAAAPAPTLDVAALAMQFHQPDPQQSRGHTSHSYSIPVVNNFHPASQQSPPMFTPYGRPLPPFLVPVSASQPPRFTFKPSMPYTHCKTISRSKPSAPKS